MAEPFLPSHGCWYCRLDGSEEAQEQYHDAERCPDNDPAMSKPLLQHDPEGTAAGPTNGACNTGSCDKQYWSCPGDAGFKVHFIPLHPGVCPAAQRPSALPQVLPCNPMRKGGGAQAVCEQISRSFACRLVSAGMFTAFEAFLSCRSVAPTT